MGAAQSMKMKTKIFSWLTLASCVLLFAGCEGDQHYKRGVEKQQNGDKDGALEEYNKAIELVPKHAAAHANRGMIKQEKGDLDGALADYDKAIELSPKFEMAYGRRAMARRSKGMLDGALADINRAIELRPTNAAAYSYRASVKFEMGDMDDAMSDCERAIALDPNSGEVHLGRAGLLHAKRDWTGALAGYRRACQLRKDQDYPHLFIWLIQYRLGDKQKADAELATYYDKERNGSPEDWAARIAGFLLGRINEEAFLAAAASPDPKKDLEQHCEAWFYAGMKRLQGGEETAAAECFKKSVGTGVKNFWEYKFSQSELKAMGR